jgi:hypothetical protein
MSDWCNLAFATGFPMKNIAAFGARAVMWLLSPLRAHRVIGSLAAIVAAMTTLDTVHAAECLENSRSVSFGDGLSRMRSFVCRGDDSTQQPTIRVEFDRLSEIAAGSLFKGTPYPEYIKAFGFPSRVPTNPPILLRSPVQAVADTMYERFGTKGLLSTCFSTAIETPKGGKDYYQKKEICGQRTIWYLTFPDTANSTRKTIFAPQTAKYINGHTDWPPGFNFYYGDCEGRDVVSCTTLWKKVSKSDEEDYRKTFSQTQEQREDAKDKNFGLLEYLMHNKWYDDFAIVSASDNECSGFDFNILLRQLIVDIALIENISDHSISLDGFIGAQSPSVELRLEDSDRGRSGGNLSVPRITLKPGEKAAVPLMLTFAPPEGFDADFANLEQSQRTYQKIRNSEEGHIFQSVEQDGKVIKKKRESFGASSRPAMPNYIFGPSLTLESIIVDGQKINLQNTAHNFVRLTAGDGYGSCPYLYVWDPEEATWIWYGKVIHGANAKEREMTQEVALTSFSLKFRIAEEEPEISYIRKVQLELELENGTRLFLDSVSGRSSGVVGNYTRIPAGNSFEVEFRLPASLTSKDVRRSTLLISGYYRRDPDLRLSGE